MIALFKFRTDWLPDERPQWPLNMTVIIICTCNRQHNFINVTINSNILFHGDKFQPYYGHRQDNHQYKNKKVKCTLVQVLRLWTGRTAHRGSRGIALPFHDHGTRLGVGVSVTFRPLFTPGKDPVPNVQEAAWAPGPAWTGAENLVPNGIGSPDRPATRPTTTSINTYTNYSFIKLYVIWIEISFLKIIVTHTAFILVETITITLYVVVSCLGCVVVSCLVCTVVVVLSVLLSSYV
jgi:hypothetical protein